MIHFKILDNNIWHVPNNYLDFGKGQSALPKDADKYIYNLSKRDAVVYISNLANAFTRKYLVKFFLYQVLTKGDCIGNVTKDEQFTSIIDGHEIVYDFEIV